MLRCPDVQPAHPPLPIPNWKRMLEQPSSRESKHSQMVTAGKAHVQVLDLKRGICPPVVGIRGSAHVRPLSKVQISTCCVAHGLVAAGGFNGELVVRRLSQEGILYG